MRPKLRAHFGQSPKVMPPTPKSDLQVALSEDRLILVLIMLIVSMVPVWPELLAHLGQGPTDDDAYPQI